MKNNIYYVIAYGYDNKHFSEFLHISSNNKPYSMFGAKVEDLKLYKSLKCAISKASENNYIFFFNTIFNIVIIHNLQFLRLFTCFCFTLQS